MAADHEREAEAEEWCEGLIGDASDESDVYPRGIREAMDFHLEGMKEHGDPIPKPSALTEYVSVGYTA